MNTTLEAGWQWRFKDENKIRLNDHRTSYQRDRARILHSAAFRRLQSKTQIHGVNLNDFHRTRLTHSLETAQIGTGIVAQLAIKQPEFAALLPSDSLIDALCLAHDIGHPPFGHGGETALNYVMRENGGFEGNAQTFRIVTCLEPYTEHHGMNLARRTLLGLMKYPTLLSQVQAKKNPEPSRHQRQLKAEDWAPAKGIFDCDKTVFNWVLDPLSGQDRKALSAHRAVVSSPYAHARTKFKSLDASIMELADDIAYGVHDLEDAIVLGIINRDRWMQSAYPRLIDCNDEWLNNNLPLITNHLFSGKHFLRKDAIGSLVNALLTSAKIHAVNDHFTFPLLAYNAYLTPSMTQILNVLKSFVSQYVIHIPTVQRFEYKGQQVVMDLFEALTAAPERLLPESTQDKWREAEKQASQGMRIICDYIAAMTDAYAQRLHHELFSSGNSW